MDNDSAAYLDRAMQIPTQKHWFRDVEGIYAICVLYTKVYRLLPKSWNGSYIEVLKALKPSLCKVREQWLILNINFNKVDLRYNIQIMVWFKIRYSTQLISTHQLRIVIIIFIYPCSKTSSRLIRLIEFDLATWNIVIIVYVLCIWLGIFLWTSTLILISQANISWM